MFFIVSMDVRYRLTRKKQSEATHFITLEQDLCEL